MSRLARAGRSLLGDLFFESLTFDGSEGTALFVGPELRAPSIAAFFCGHDAGKGRSGRVMRRSAADHLTGTAAEGGLSVLRLRQPDQRLAGILPLAVTVPGLVDVHTELPEDVDTLRDQLRTSTTREDLRRIRKAGFTYRVTKDPAVVREFHSRHYRPLVAKQYPEDGRVSPVGRMIDDLDHGGELVCADIDGEWVAGIFNVDRTDRYALMTLGIRGADDAVRQKRVVAALIVRSLERGVELGRDRATLGRSLPFLGKGPVWFKVKWNGTVSRGISAHDLHMLMDLRHAGVRRMLAASPVVHRMGEDLVVSAWLEPGDQPLKVITREAGRFPGIARWYVLGEPAVLNEGAVRLSSAERVVPVPVIPSGDHPIWLAKALPVAPT